MPVNVEVAQDTWDRYMYMRDNGHLDYVQKAYRCEEFFAGMQWDKNDMALLKQQRRPALTINKIISTLSNVMGEQIFNRSEIAFRPRNGESSDEIANMLTKVFMQISDQNQLPWLRSDMFADGIIGSRGFLDMRLSFEKNLRGELVFDQLNPKNVMIDPDAEDMDPDKWADVIVSKWMSPDQIALLYSKKDAELLKGRTESFMPYGMDSIDVERDRFGPSRGFSWGYGEEQRRDLARNIRVIDRQWRKLDKVQHFVDLKTGTMEQVPYAWDEDQIGRYRMENPDTFVIKKLVHRIRWTVVADNVVLHDDWSPYRHFTVIPFFPYFRRGRTIGLVENLLGPQELLNKTSSQELHVINTTANSGWKIKTGSLRNMSTGELETRGAQTGIVLELDDINNAEKIQPNSTPTGLDRITFKAEESIKNISGVTDYQSGNAREDVSAKAIKQNRAASSGNFAKVMDNLSRTDYLLGRNALDIVQEYYTEPRIVTIVTDKMMNTTEQAQVNQVLAGKIVNDLSLGEYGVVVTLVPERDTFEDTQFDQIIALRESGVPIPDKYVIQASRLKDKTKIIEDMTGNQNSPEAQAAAALKKRADEGEVAKVEAEARQKDADAQAKLMKAQKEAGQDNTALAELEQEREKMMAELEMDREKMEAEFALKKQAMEREFALKMQMQQKEFALKANIAQQDADTRRAAEVTKAQKESAKPSSSIKE